MKHLKFAILFFIVSEAWSQNAAENRDVNMYSSDFDFIIGEWTVNNKVLKERLSESNEWIKFPATCKIWKIMDGMVVIDEFYSTIDGQKQIGSSYRIYNRNKNEWTIYWASTAYPDLGLIPQVKGTFKDGEGRFFGEEGYNGKMVRLRFSWSKNPDGSPHWEQAYFDEKNKTWETNWIMDFEKR